jgi:biotin synthase
MTQIIKGVKDLGLAITLSIGERPREELAAFKAAGADRYLLRVETTDRQLYKQMHPGMSLARRIECLKDLKELGFETGSGIIIGLPKQSLQSIAKDILFLKNLPVDMAGVGPFIAHPQTPLAAQGAGADNFDLSLKVMAVMRLLLPKINIPATTAMETLRPDGRLIALQSGANVVMPNITPPCAAGDYQIYPNKFYAAKTPVQYKPELEEKLRSIGRFIEDGPGQSLAFTKK